MINRVYALMLTLLLATSCDNGEPIYDIPNSDDSISFAVEELSADWSQKSETRGSAVTDFNSDVSSIMVYAFVSNRSDIKSCFIDNKLAAKNVSDVWGFTPACYYPLYESLDFLAYTPQEHYASDDQNNGLSHELDFDNKKLTFTYSVPLIGRNHPDFMLAKPQTEISRDQPLSTMQFDHALTQVTMSAKVDSDTEEDRYIIKSFTMFDITTAATMSYDTTDGMGDWTETMNSEFITSAMLPDESLDETPVKLKGGSEFVSIMSNGEALFMIPQEIEDKVNSGGDAPTIEITVYDTIDDKTYSTDKLVLPSPFTAGWEAGQHVNIQFEFGLSDGGGSSSVVPLSLTAELQGWIEQIVNEDINACIYAYLDKAKIDNTVTELKLYTDGVPTKVTADGTIFTDATLSTVSTDGYYTITPTIGASGSGTLTVEFESANNKVITKVFRVTVE